MARISLELDAQLNKQLKQYMTDRFGFTHGKQQEVIREALRAFLKAGKGAAAIVVEKDLANEPVKATSRSKPIRKTTRKSPIAEDDQAKIREIWDTSKDHNISAIAKQFPQYNDRQVRHWIDRNIRT